MPPAGRGKASARLPDVRGTAETPRGFEGNTAGLLLLDPDYLPLDVMRKRSGSGGGGGEEEEGGGGGGAEAGVGWQLEPERSL